MAQLKKLAQPAEKYEKRSPPPPPELFTRKKKKKKTFQILCIACVVTLRVTDDESARVYHSLRNRSREWFLLNNITWGVIGKYQHEDETRAAVTRACNVDVSGDATKLSLAQRSISNTRVPEVLTSYALATTDYKFTALIKNLGNPRGFRTNARLLLFPTLYARARVDVISGLGNDRRSRYKTLARVLQPT